MAENKNRIDEIPATSPIESLRTNLEAKIDKKLDEKIFIWGVTLLGFLIVGFIGCLVWLFLTHITTTERLTKLEDKVFKFHQ